MRVIYCLEKDEELESDENETFKAREKDNRKEEQNATYFMKIQEQECFDEITTYVVELPVK